MIKTVTATEAKNNFGEVNQLAKESVGGVYIKQYGEPVTVIVSVKEYESLKQQAEELRLLRLIEEIERVRKEAYNRLPPDLKNSPASEVLREAGFSEGQIEEIIELDTQMSGEQ